MSATTRLLRVVSRFRIRSIFFFCIVVGLVNAAWYLHGFVSLSKNDEEWIDGPFLKTSAKTETTYFDGCRRWQGIMKPQDVKETLLKTKSPRGILVTLFLGDQLSPYLKDFIPSQVEHFVGPHELDMLLVVKPQSKPSIQEIRKALNLTSVQHPLRNWLNLDGSRLTTLEHRLGNTRVYLAESEIQLPQYVIANRSILDVPITPEYCQESVDYIQGTRWYTNEMLHLAILKEYEFFIKVDVDVVFEKTIPFNLLHDMKLRRAIFGHTAQYPDHMVAVCADEITDTLRDFRQDMIRRNPPWVQSSKWNGSICSNTHPKMHIDSDLYYSNFIIGRTDYFQSREVLSLSRFLSEDPRGFFKHRWTDQAFWHFALGLFIGSNFEDVVADYTDLRCSPEKNCWMSSHDPERIINSFNRCDNGGYFMHTKSYARSGPENSLLDKEISLERHVLPYNNQYVHDCRKSKWRYKALNIQ